MSDEEPGYVPKKYVHYGSLEESEKKRSVGNDDQMETDAGSVDLDGIAGSPSDNAAKAKIGNKSHVYTSNGENFFCESVSHVLQFSVYNFFVEYMPMEETVPEDKQAALDELERKKRARMMAITTDDSEVRRYLRQLGEPITLFGEGPADRRNRLKELLSYYGTDAIEKKKEEEREVSKQEKDQAETTWYHEGPDSLKTARLWLAYYSLPRAKQRLVNAKLELETPEATRTAKRYFVK